MKGNILESSEVSETTATPLCDHGWTVAVGLTTPKEQDVFSLAAPIMTVTGVTSSQLILDSYYINDLGFRLLILNKDLLYVDRVSRQKQDVSDSAASAFITMYQIHI